MKRVYQKETAGDKIMHLVNAALMRQTNQCILGMDQWDSIAGEINKEIAAHAKALLEHEPDILEPIKDTDE